MDAVRANRHLSQIITRKSIENTIASVAATAVSADAISACSASRAKWASHSPSTTSTSSPSALLLSATSRLPASMLRPDYQAAGGSRLLAQRLIDAGHANGATLTISGKTLAEEAALAAETPGQVVIHTFDKPIKPNGGLVILKGNLAPEGCVMKVAAANHLEHRTSGPARVFDTEEACFEAVQTGKIKPNDVLVIRYEGPRGWPRHERHAAVQAAAVSGIHVQAGVPPVTELVVIKALPPLPLLPPAESPPDPALTSTSVP